MDDIKELKQRLNDDQREILKRLLDPEATLLFNIKGMVQITYLNEPFEFVEMGFDDIETLLKMGLLEPLHPEQHENVLEGREYRLSGKGITLAQAFKT